MSQEEVLDILEKEDKITAKDIALKLHICYEAVRTNLLALLKSHEVKRVLLLKKEFNKKITYCKRINGVYLWQKIKDDRIKEL
jgi:phosphosulfolactate phosphohydrolase-like enzyme